MRPRLARRLALGAIATAAACGGVLAACASEDASSFGPSGADASPPSPFADASAGPSDAGSGLVSSGVLLVHGGSAPALRLCFGNRPQDPPVPLDVLMPESNLVGLDVGAVLRLPNQDEPLGTIVGFAEKDLRGQLLADGGATETCGTLVDSSTFASKAYGFGEVTANLSRGLHVVALVGCPPAARDPLASKERCGATWTSEVGNLRTLVTRLQPGFATSSRRLTLQLVQLSPSLDVRLDGGRLALGVEADAGTGEAFTTVAPLGTPVPSSPASLELPDAAELDYEGVNLVLDVVTGTDGGARERVLTQSLLETQRLSFPESIPPSFFASVSSFVVLSVGELPPTPPDAGRDPRARLHLLAVPLGEELDGGAR